MDIVIISQFGEHYSETDNDRFLYLAKMLATNTDNSIEIVTSSFRHTTKSQRVLPEADWPFKITFIKEPGYPKNICLKRFFSHRIWGKRLARYLSSRSKPDVVYCAVPSLTGPYLVSKYCEKNQIRFIIDVQDLWPEAFQMVFNVPILSSMLYAPFTSLANGIYKRADAICAVSDTYCERALSVNNKCKETTTVFLGTELETFNRFAAIEPILKKKEDEVWLAYCGTLGSSYDLTCVIGALGMLDNKRVRFIIMGDGPKMEEFKEKAEEIGINATFTGRLPYHQMCSLLSSCDIAVNPITHLAAQSIINKHADYAASGLPVISTQESAEYRALIDEYQMGFNCKNNDAVDLAARMKALVEDKRLRSQMGINARRCAVERFDRKNTYSVLKKVIING